ncbi:S41 family peptidase [soil metagenome]
MLNKKQSEPEEGVTVKRTNVKKILAGAVAAFLIFSFGVGVGNGSILIGPDAAFKRSQNDSLPSRLDYSSVDRVYDKLRLNYDGDLTVEQLMDGLKSGLARATGDSYTEYLNAEAAEEFDADLSGTFSGIGAELGKEGNTVLIVAPIDGYPAEKAGLRPKDVIVEIDGESSFDISVTEAVKRIRGPEGTKVKLKVIRDSSREVDFEITRAQISIPSVESEILEGNIGYLKISRFSEDTAQLARRAATEFKQKNVKGVVLDLRSNPGGLLDTSVSISSLWLPKGTTVLEEKRGDVVVKTLKSSGDAILEGVPTVVLINEGSASASEITAGALRDHNVATLVGQKSFGKGSVQSLERLTGGGVLKVTIARWFTPGGKNIDKEGIEPDHKVERTEEDFKADRDPQKDEAVRRLRR